MGPAFWQSSATLKNLEKTKKQKNADPMAGQSKLGDIGPAFFCFFVLLVSSRFVALFQKTKKTSRKPKQPKKNKIADPMAGQSKLGDIGPAILVVCFLGFLEVFCTLPEKLKKPRENQKNADPKAGQSELGDIGPAICLVLGEMRLQDAIEATKALYFRDLPAHVCVGPMPVGGFTLPELPLRDLDAGAPSIKHFVDVVMDIPAGDINIENIKAIFRDQAWDELPAVMKPKSRPSFDTATQYILLPQTHGNICLLKHTYVVDEKVTGQCVIEMLQGKGYEISWGTGNKKVVRKAFQWMLEQLGGTQFRRYTLSPEKRKPVAEAPQPEDEGWAFLQEHGEFDKSGLKQLRWIHHHINAEGCPIKGWSERLVQKALDTLANDTTTAKLCRRYDLTVKDSEPEARQVLEKIVPHLRDHSLWFLGENSPRESRSHDVFAVPWRRRRVPNHVGSRLLEGCALYQAYPRFVR